MLRPWPVPQEDVNLLKEYNMAKLLIESEYDMDVALAETIKLVKLKHTTLDVGFNSLGMVNIFLENLYTMLKDNEIQPDEKDFHLNIMVRQDEQA